jgi:RHH-type rel operon transcriptional repressor/antitoxin RelB
MLAIRLPEEIENRLNALAKETGRSKSFYVREAILEHLVTWKTFILRENVSQISAPAGAPPFLSRK